MAAFRTETLNELDGQTKSVLVTTSLIKKEEQNEQEDDSSKLQPLRDLLKSETCYTQIPELELEIGPATLDGRFSTVKGILIMIKEQPSSSIAFRRDSSDPDTMKRIDGFISHLNEVLEGKWKITFVLDDPSGNSYTQSLSDKGLEIKRFGNY
ncbi:Zinc finger protein ZPR1 [Eufriesea mexicana]|uniref:Zinc finger protein ZPR1 n=1 Tax=Eufriesea mexicana TaxID=516756 RepID=A0A310SPN4_9HYME|nr:Zinc finger protein ZPR1 [Eufriesea mexicana]